MLIKRYKCDLCAAYGKTQEEMETPYARMYLKSAEYGDKGREYHLCRNCFRIINEMFNIKPGKYSNSILYKNGCE